MLQPQRVNTLNVLARCHFGGLNGTYTYMLLARWSLSKLKQASYLTLVNSSFSLTKPWFDTNFTTQVYPSSFNLKKLG
jgi:hypothetical protein